MKLSITIVGAGHYGRDLIAEKYRQHPQCVLKSVISPNIKPQLLSKGSLAKVPLYRSPEQWAKGNGKAMRNDLFDLCVHPPVLPGLVKSLIRIGARNFVFPKPVAATPAALKELLRLQRVYSLKITVASQWYYSKATQKAADLIHRLCRAETLDQVRLDFSQFFSDSQLQHYTPATALLPHMLQIVYSLGLHEIYQQDSLKIKRQTPNCWILIGHPSARWPEIRLITDMKRRRRRRMMEVFSQGSSKPALRVNFLRTSNNRMAVRYPSVTFKNRSWMFREDVLEVMTNRIVRGFRQHSLKEMLTLDRYLPVAALQISGS